MSATAVAHKVTNVVPKTLGHSGVMTGSLSALNRFVFVCLLVLIVLVAIPYGTVEAWWIAAFECTVFGLGLLWLGETSVRGEWNIRNWSILSPIVAATGFVFIQSLTVSADPIETRTIFFKTLALATVFLLLSQYVNSQKRLNQVIHLVLLIAVVSALFGIIRHTQQNAEVGFGLPLLRRDSGFAQFVNKNHFALLMEMALGLVTGLVFGGGVKRDRILFYVSAAAVMWTALVMTSSRGGLFSTFGQLVFLATVLLWFRFRNRKHLRGGRPMLSLAPVAALSTLALIAVAASALWLGGDLLVTRLESLSGEIRSEANDPHAGVRRREVWQATLELIKAHPVAGSGFGAYQVAITRFHDGSGKWTPEAAHNDYLELVASGGVIGVLIFACFVVVFAKRIRLQLKQPDPTRRAACLGALTGIVGVAAHSVVDFGLHVTANAVVFMVLIVVATTNLQGEFQQQREREFSI
jgi:O-antigen ligase